MAVVKSFDLKGNKQSFASWISNLSPCDSPFTSMIGKEGITQIQYSWQTDALAPADNTTYEEGSQVASQTRPTTKEMTNFTSVLRKVVQISETAEALDTHGRSSEMKYQVGKSGKEIMRDLEWMNLSHVTSFPGTPSRASQHAGFEGLVAGLDIPDPDTGAIVHKTIEVSGARQTAIDKADIFDMTYNLYLAGSKANKIMYHPKHALAFSALIGNNPEEARSIRMFDNMNNTFNSFVSKIRDPLGREYTLLPNRYMPEDKIYFFTEADWTQMILRAPVLTKLSKTGSSDSMLMEMEVGLRHTHPYASGVLTLTSVVVHNTFVPSRILFTSHISDSQEVRCETTVDGVAEAGLTVTWYSSNSEVIQFTDLTSTSDSNGRANNSLVANVNTGFADVWTVCKGVKSAVTRVTVGNPVITLIVNNDSPAQNETITLTAEVKKAGGTTPVGNGVEVKWFVDPSTKLELNSVSSTTTAGIATTTARVLRTDPILLQATLGRNVSNKIILNYVPTPSSIINFAVTPRTIPIGSFSDLTAKVLDERGISMVGVAVTWVSTDINVAQSNQPTSTTIDGGVATGALRGVARGTCLVSAVVGNVESSPVICHVGHNASLDFEINPNPANENEDVRFYGSIKSQDGAGIPDVAYVITSDTGNPAMRLDGTTDDDGDFTKTYAFPDNSDHDITIEIPSLNLTRTESLKIN
ncbi:MAG: SU10 major capsid protein [Bacteroidales bacterium]